LIILKEIRENIQLTPDNKFDTKSDNYIKLNSFKDKNFTKSSSKKVTILSKKFAEDNYEILKNKSVTNSNQDEGIISYLKKENEKLSVKTVKNRDTFSKKCYKANREAVAVVLEDSILNFNAR
jgi:hypothetical protein